MLEYLLAAPAAVLLYFFSSLRILKQYERGVVFFLGRYTATRGPGLVFVPRGFAQMRRVSMRIVAIGKQIGGNAGNDQLLVQNPDPQHGARGDQDGANDTAGGYPCR